MGSLSCLPFFKRLPSAALLAMLATPAYIACSDDAAAPAGAVVGGAGGMSAGGMSAGGMAAGGMSAGGMSAGGMSAAGMSAGGTSSGGAPMGGGSAGGALAGAAGSGAQAPGGGAGGAAGNAAPPGSTCKQDEGCDSGICTDGVCRPKLSFAAPQKLALTAAKEALVVADFNGDGALDIAYGQGTQANVAVVLGNGDGSFQPPLSSPGPGGTHMMDAGDFNGDGKLDLVTAGSKSSGTGQDGAFFQLGNGDGTFQAASPLSSARFTGRALAIADLDGDGDLDVAIPGGIFVDEIYIWLSNNDGTFAAPLKTKGTHQPSYIAAADFNADQKADLAVDEDSNLSVLLQSSTWLEDSPEKVGLVGLQIAGMALGDFNEDGHVDLACVDYGKGGRVVLNKGGSGFTSGGAVDMKGTGKSGPVAGLVAADFDGDGHLDLASQSGNGGAFVIARGRGGAKFRSPVLTPGTGFSRALFAADLNKDQRPDFITLASGEGQVQIVVALNTTP